MKFSNKVNLADLCDDISYGYTESACKDEVGPKFLRITDISGSRLEWRNVPYCKISDNNLIKYKLNPGDIIIARTGATTGANYTIKNSDPRNVVFASYLIRYKINTNVAYPFFIGFVLQSSNWKEYVEAISGGSAQPGANAKQLGSFEIDLPPLPEQKAIASVLSSLDDKIDLLHRQNETLEKMAETLFRKWFVEDAKEDWEEKPLSSIAEFLNGLACQKYPPKNNLDRLPVLKIKELSNGFTDNSDWCSSDVNNKYIIQNGDIIFSWSASLIVKIWDGESCILNQHLFKVSSEDYPKWYYYLWCNQHLAEFISISSSHATTMGHIKRSDLDNAKVLVPSNQELIIMNNSFEPLIEKIIANNKQLKKLTQIRDTLLPKLMSGEVRVKLE